MRNRVIMTSQLNHNKILQLDFFKIICSNKAIGDRIPIVPLTMTLKDLYF